MKLADLGVAAQLYNTMSKRGTMIGTPHWMAPETLAQSGGEDGKYDAKVDVWGVGITAIELVQMSPPFSEVKSVFQVRAARRAMLHRERDDLRTPPPVAQLVPLLVNDPDREAQPQGCRTIPRRRPRR